MSYQSVGFLLFSAVVLLVYYLLGRKCQRWVLAAGNLIFYAAAGPQYLPFLLVTMLATYLAGRGMGRVYEKADEQLKGCTTPEEKKAVKASARKQARRMLLIGLLVTIALLVVCKYTGFILTNINSLLLLLQVPQLTVFRMILPLGISFYSFMALSYVLDVYWKRYPAETDFLTYAVYLSYFPHVVQGPIDRFNEFRTQIRDGVKLDTRVLASGAQLVIWGLFKKLVIADRIEPFVSHAFTSWSECSGSVLLMAMLAYSVQIYADFSGCIDIVSGISEMFGIRLRRNFNHPYFSRTMGEFWRRWHISLQEWFKDYIYYPVSASNLMRRAKKHFQAKNDPRGAELFSGCFPVLVVWLITGIWHGASWNYVIWGIYHAILLIGSQVFAPQVKKLSALCRFDPEKRLWRFWQMTRTFLLCGIGRIIFRAETLAAAFGYMKRMVTEFSAAALFRPLLEGLTELLRVLRTGSLTTFYVTARDMVNRDFGAGITPANIVMAFIVTAVLWIVDMKQEKQPLRETLAKKKLWFRWMIIFAGIFAIIIFGVYGPGYDAKSFIYEQF